MFPLCHRVKKACLIGLLAIISFGGGVKKIIYEENRDENKQVKQSTQYSMKLIFQ